MSFINQFDGLSLQAALKLTLSFLIISSCIQTFEFIRNKKNWSDNGIWRSSILQNEFDFLIDSKFYFLIKFVYSDSFFTFLNYLKLFICIMLLLFPGWIWILFLLIIHWVICVRYRGTYNGGSDMMMTVVLIGSLFGLSNSIKVAEFGVFFIAINLLNSYFIAGLVKIKNKDWLYGRALRYFILSSPYNQHSLLGLKKWVLGDQSNWWMRILSLLTIFFELTCPVVLFSTQVGFIYFIFAIGFHFFVFLTFGLNRFFWIWLSAWPSLLYVIGQIR